MWGEGELAFTENRDVPGTVLMCICSFNYDNPVGHFSYYHSHYTGEKSEAQEVTEIAQGHS